MASESRSQFIRRQLDHPVVDGDGHWVEPLPVLLEYLREIGGVRLTEDFLKQWPEQSGRGWYDATPQQRSRHRTQVPPWWTLPAHTLDRATSMIPRLLHQRLQEFGIDFSLIYPSMAVGGFYLRDAQIRRAFCRAYNHMVADLFRPYADRLSPVAIVPTVTPQEAIEEAEYAVRQLGLKAVVITGTVRRPIQADEEWQSDPARRRQYIDGIGLDSVYDYDPLWRKCMELRVAVTTHGGSLGWMDRSSPTNWVSNHLGHFAQANSTFARSVILGGVTQRFPRLNFGFLEGGVGWACILLSDLVGHWKKRNRSAMEANLRPTNMDPRELLRLFERYADDPRYEGKREQIVERNLQPMDPSRTSEEIAAREKDIDDFRNLRLSCPEDVRRLFSENFYFGCEADDPITSWAFKAEVNHVELKPIFGSDIAHFDVTDMREVLEEAHELLEDGLIDARQFRAFVFGNTVALHGRMSPDFFRGTAVETAAAGELAQAGAASGAA